MAAANYMTEADTESIWSTALDTTRFGKIGVRIAEFINFKLYHDATNQCTNTAVTPLLEQFSEEVLTELISGAKGTDVVVPWDFIQANFVNAFHAVYRRWYFTFKEIKDVLQKHHRIKYSNELMLLRWFLKS